MNDQNYKTAFNKLFNGYTTENEFWRRTDANWCEITGILNMSGRKFKDSYIKAYFYHNPETYIYTHSAITFEKIPKRMLKEIFNNQNYNYDLVDTIINELFTIGESFSFYKDMSPIQNINIENTLNLDQFGQSTPKNVTKITLASFLKDKRAGSQPIKRMARQSIKFKLFDDNICPIMELIIPYSNTDYFHSMIHLHPAMKDKQIDKIEELKANFTAQLEEQLEIVLNKKLKISKNDIKNMTLQEKRNYIPVLEMLTV
jgi:hypothetical protein